MALALAAAALSAAVIAPAASAVEPPMCPGDVALPLGPPDTPYDSLNRVVEEVLPENGVARICYDPSASGCSAAARVALCFTEEEEATGAGSCEGSARVERFTLIVLTVEGAPVYSRHYVRSACDADSGAGSFEAYGVLVPVAGYQLHWSHDWTTCGMAVVLTWAVGGIRRDTTCSPLLHPPLGPSLP